MNEPPKTDDGHQGAGVPNSSSSADDAEPRADPRSQSMEKLTPEEQMALYEKELKENDWGHQPC